MDRYRLASRFVGCQINLMAEDALQKYTKGDSPTSSFTFKIVMAMILIAIVPAGISLYIFHLIAKFNQDLQQEAVASIDSVSDVYKSWVKSESERMKLITGMLELKVDNLLDKHQVTRVRDVRLSDGFRKDLQALFEETVQDDIVFDVRLSYNMEPLVQANKPMVDAENYKFQMVELPVAIRSRFQAENVLESSSDTTEMPMLIAEPDDPDTEMDTIPALPENLNSESGMPIASTRGIRMSVIFGLSRAQSDLYEQIGERRYLHNSISAVENDRERGIASVRHHHCICTGSAGKPASFDADGFCKARRSWGFACQG